MKSYYIEDIHETDAHYPERKDLIGKRIEASEVYVRGYGDEGYVICFGRIPGVMEDCCFAAVKLAENTVC